MLIHEIILENFMSYEYARIPLNLGLNIVCGPNGAGKSSILLAISVALGQAYTERGHKFSDLIRWGEDSARVTLVFDNKPRGNGRPIPKLNTDFFRLSRYLTKDGNYWFQANSETITKSEVVSLLSNLGINPDNMLIIMHQHMMMEFGVTSPQQKLLLIEEAVGFREYREKVFMAREKLTQVLSEEESVTTLLKNAEQTLAYWKGEYERYQRKKELLIKKDTLEREFSWAQLIKQERITEEWKNKIWIKEDELLKKEQEKDETRISIKELDRELIELRHKKNKVYYRLLTLEKDNKEIEESINSLNITLKKIADYKQIFSNDKDYNKIFLDPKLFEIINQDKMYITVGNHSEAIQELKIRFNELQIQSQVFKQEADKLEKEKMLLEKLTKDKKTKEDKLQQNRKKLEKVSAIIDRLGPILATLNPLEEQITLEEAIKDSLIRELNNLIKRLPSNIKIKQINDSIELAKEVSHKLLSEIDSRNTIRKQIKKGDAILKSLIDEQQTVSAEIYMWESEIEKLTKQRSEINLCIKEKGEKPIKCDKCGSILPPDQWITHLEKIEEQIKVNKNKLNTHRNKLKGIHERLYNQRKELDNLNQDEKIIEAINLISTQATQIFKDLENSCKTLEKKLNEKRRIEKDLFELNRFYPGTNLLEKGNNVLNEAHILKLSISQIEREISNFGDLYIKPQRERFKNALTASDNYQKILPKIIEKFKMFLAEIDRCIQIADQKKGELEGQVSNTQIELNIIEEKIGSFTENYQNERAKEAFLLLHIGNTKNEIDKLKKSLKEAQRELDQLQPLAEKTGVRIETERRPWEISADLKIINAHLASLGEVSEDVENMYMNYLNLCSELKEKIAVVSENRESVLKELDERNTVWRNILQTLLDQVNPIFQAFLEKIGAIGKVRLVNQQDIEMAGLELIIGFKGAKPKVLDSRTQSGGERSSATMAFLLALQRHIKSPFRAVDEFDVHMDPRNRETISQMLLKETQKDGESQYLTITPGQLTNLGKGVQIITVQNVEGRSKIEVAA